MAEPSSDSLAIEGSLLELYEPNAHAAPMVAIDFLHDLARRSATMPSALSKDLLNRQRVTTHLRLRTEAALLRVACTHADVRIEDNGHGAWLVSAAQKESGPPLRSRAFPRPTSSRSASSLDGKGRKHPPAAFRQAPSRARPAERATPLHAFTRLNLLS